MSQDTSSNHQQKTLFSLEAARRHVSRYRTLSIAISVLLLFATLMLLIAIPRGNADAEVLNIAGRQRMLSQQAVLKAFALERILTDHGQGLPAAELEERLHDFNMVIDQLVANQAWLKAQSFGQANAGSSDQNQNEAEAVRNENRLRVLFAQLEPHLEAIVGATDDINMLHTGWDEDARASDKDERLKQASQSFLAIMEKIVNTYESEVQQEKALLQACLLFITSILVLTLVLQLIMALIPSARSLDQVTPDVMDMFHQIQEARANAEEYALFAHNSTNAMVRTDANRRITWVNEGFTRVAGYTFDEMSGRTPGELLQFEKTDPQTVQQIRTSLENKEPFHGHILNRSKDGREYWVDLEILPDFDSNGQLQGFISIGSDVTELMNLMERSRLLADERAWLTAAVERGPEPMVVANLNGDVRFANKAAIELDRRLGHEIKPGGKAYLFTEAFMDEGRLGRRLLETLASGGEFSEQVEIHAPADAGIDAPAHATWLHVIASPLTNENNQVEHIILIKRDITEQIRRENELNSARERAEEASKAKSEFLANMSHEIRTPMTAILGYADLLNGDLEDDAVASGEAVRTIQSNAGHLLTIINDILDVSKIEAGQMTIEQINMNPAQIVEEVASLARPRAKGKGVDLRVDYETTMPKNIKSDPTRLRQILLNLTGNAIKFTEIGSVTISVACDVSGERMTFRVRDTGIGMTEAQRQVIAKFEAFTQADASTTRKHGGTGLGLRICSALAEMLGGVLSVESEVGEGSTFSVSIATGDLAGVKMDDRISVEESRHQMKQHRLEKSDGKSRLNGIRILLAEDGIDNQRLISFHLQRAGAEILLHDNGLSAVEYIEAAMEASRDPQIKLENELSLPDIILMDMQMPKLDGYQATSRLRRTGIGLPVIALTAHAMDGDRQKCMDAGCSDYLTKPINKSELIEMCLRWANGNQLRSKAG